jgi:hypothetical protein
MGRAIDIKPGDPFGRWTAIRRVENSPRGAARYLCRCECGTEKPVVVSTLASGKSTSCGCWRSDDRGTARMGEARAARRPENHPRGDGYYRAKLDAAAVRKARELSARGYKLGEIMDLLKIAVDKSTLSFAINRRTWKSVE